MFELVNEKRSINWPYQLERSEISTNLDWQRTEYFRLMIDRLTGSKSIHINANGARSDRVTTSGTLASLAERINQS